MLEMHMEHLNCVLSAISLKYKDCKYFLDVGCGDGRRTVIFDEFKRVIFGVDCRDDIDIAIKKRISFRQEDFIRGQLSYKDESFDMAISFDVIEHLTNPEIMLKEVHRLLKKSGVFIISTPNRYRIFGFLLLILGLRKFPYYPDKSTIKYDPYSAHVNEYTIRQLKSLLERQNFKVIKAHRVFYGMSGRLGIRYLFSLPFFHNIILECVKRN